MPIACVYKMCDQSDTQAYRKRTSSTCVFNVETPCECIDEHMSAHTSRRTHTTTRHTNPSGINIMCVSVAVDKFTFNGLKRYERTPLNASSENCTEQRIYHKRCCQSAANATNDGAAAALLVRHMYPFMYSIYVAYTHSTKHA